MQLTFYKYQGTGNDFIMIDDLNRSFPSDDIDLISRLCDRKFGIGSDGIILIQKDTDLDFYVDFINPDGSRSFCGNGSRCAVKFAQDLGIIEDKCVFNAIDGIHEARIINDIVELRMSDVDSISQKNQDYFLDTGSPHHIVFNENIDTINVKKLGASIRYNDEYKDKGVNVNFVELTDKGIYVRTYERGVEDETLSCGTGVTAAVLATVKSGRMHGDILVKTKGGYLKILLKEDSNGFSNIWLCGKAEQVYQGRINL